jgi:hypothetical protein
MTEISTRAHKRKIGSTKLAPEHISQQHHVMHPGRRNDREERGVDKMALPPDLALSRQGEVAREKREESAPRPVHHTAKDRKRGRRERKGWCHSRGRPPQQGASCPSPATTLLPDLALSRQGEGVRESWACASRHRRERRGHVAGACGGARGAVASSRRSAARHSAPSVAMVACGEEWLALVCC